MAAKGLSDEHRTFIVQRLARFDTPQEVADAVKEEYGISISRQAVQFYDPTVGPKPAKKWIALFEATRAAFLDKSADLAATHAAWRIAQLEDMVRRAKKSKNYKLAAELLEQIAKECGGMYRNVRATEKTPQTADEQVAALRTAMEAMDATIGTAPPLALVPSPATGAAA